MPHFSVRVFIIMKKIWDIFWRFLALGCVSFGGPAAHIGYFRTTFVERLQWLDEAAYARLIALSQFLPGPGSSQIGFAIGLRRGGLYGSAAAFLGFTIPSFVLMYLLAVGMPGHNPNVYFTSVVFGLKLMAVIIVADATLSMFHSFCKERLSIGIAAFTATFLLILPGLWSQMTLLVIAAVIGSMYGKPQETEASGQSRFRWIPLALFFILFFGSPFLSFISSWGSLFADFYQAGSLVFGGGHVVLPLLQELLAETISTDRFLLGYAAAQAVPGPMFSLAAFLGSELTEESKLIGALLATAGIFLPGFLLVISLQGAWETLAARPGISGAAWGINAAVVGLLMSVLYRPVFISAVSTPVEMALVILGFFALRTMKIPIVALVMVFAGIGLFFRG